MGGRVMMSTAMRIVCVCGGGDLFASVRRVRGA